MCNFPEGDERDIEPVMNFVKSLAVYDNVKSFVYAHSIGWCNELKLVVLSEMEGSKLECCQLQMSLKKKYLQLFVGQNAFFWGGGCFLLFHTYLMLFPQLSFSHIYCLLSKFPSEMMGQGFTVLQLKTKVMLACLLVHNKVVINEYDWLVEEDFNAYCS